MISLTPHSPSNLPGELLDKCTEVYKQSAKLEATIRPGLSQAVRSLLELVNSYYSNKMEGNPTQPADILKTQYFSNDNEVTNAKDDTRDAYTEILAHIAAQQYLSAHPPGFAAIASSECMQDIHKHFFERVPEQHRKIEHPSTKQVHIVVPGELRTTQVTVGNHVAPRSEELNGYMNWFHSSYRLDHLHGNTRLIAAAAAHHRLLWIHPFLDGNGRVARLFTDTYLKMAGVDGHGLWSISRGFSRTMGHYKSALARADYPRQGVTDGRGILSDKGLFEFQNYFFDTCLDQINYIIGLLDVQGFNHRLEAYVTMRCSGGGRNIFGQPLNSWRPQTALLLQAVISNINIKRSQVPAITGLGDTLSRKLVNQLIHEGWLTGKDKQPLQLKLPSDGISPLFPHLW